MRITAIIAREILDSRGNPTVEVDVHLSNGAWGRTAVPSGASTGRHEALELRDGDPQRFQGKGVLRAIQNIQEVIAPALKGCDASQQQGIDERIIELDGTPNKSRLGANATLGVSLACAKASAQAHQVPLYRYLGGEEATLLPVPLLNVLNGGKHAQNNLTFQEFMLIPAGAPTFRQAIQMGAEIQHTLKKILHQKGLATGVGDEGGFAPNLETQEQALSLLVEAIQSAGYTPARDVFLGIDAAASEFFQKNLYLFSSGTPRERDISQMVEYYQDLLSQFPLISLEDPLAEDDWEGWKLLSQHLNDRCQIVGDDLFVTNLSRLRKGIEENIGNSILIKPNQIGTLTETVQTITEAQHAGYTTVLSHRSGETEDTTIADIAVAYRMGQIKAGALCRSERVAKYNQLLRIEEELGAHAEFASLTPFARFLPSKKGQRK
ncbi:MAG: phosphopyruvate hydratase [Fimbriimonadales bacterium]|nr:phosphopyruvate hydratase [Fimbriimonadales bacterium]